MTDVTIRIVCDRAQALNFGVWIGANWIRIVVNTPPVPNWAPHLHPIFAAVKNMIGVFAVSAPEQAAVLIEGPDSFVCLVPGAAEIIKHTWLVALTGAPLPTPSAAPAVPTKSVSTAVTASPPMPTASPSSASGPTIVVPRPGATQGAIGVPGALDPRLKLVIEMAQVVKSHVAAHGSAPSFQPAAFGDNTKAHNYIRTVTGARTVDTDILEHVRSILAVQHM